MLTRNKVLLSKVETTKGTDAVPIPADDLIMPNGELQISLPTEKDTGEGDIKGTFGPGDSVTLKQTLGLEISTRVRGLGGVGGALVPDIHALLIASGHAVTLGGDGTTTPRTATYVPTSVAATIENAAATTYFYEDGLLYKLLGGVNTLAFEAAMNVLMAKASIQAGYSAPTVVALPAWSAPDGEIFRMTSALCAVTQDAAPINIGSFTFDCGVDVQENYETGSHFFEIANRNPTLVIDPKAVATVADFTALTNSTGFAFVATFTNSLGETLVFSAPNAQINEISTADRAGRITRQKTFSLKETTGDDQYSIVWTGVI